MGLNDGVVGLSGLRIVVLRLSEWPIAYDVIFYEEDYVILVFYIGGIESECMIAEIGG